MLAAPTHPVPPDPTALYIIASTLRTGSYLLCEGLEATGRAGHPQEIFCPERRADYCGCWQLPKDTTLADFLRVAIRNGMTENGVCGMKIHWHHLGPLGRESGLVGDPPAQVLTRLFPTAKYIHLRRRDHRAQAISWYRAMVTNEWWRITGVVDNDLTGRQPAFNGAEIHRLELELARQQNAWEEFFALQPDQPLLMDYESLAADYRGEVARALAFIGQDPAFAQAIPEPRLIRQSDATTGEWRRWMDTEFPE